MLSSSLHIASPSPLLDTRTLYSAMLSTLLLLLTFTITLSTREVKKITKKNYINLFWNVLHQGSKEKLEVLCKSVRRQFLHKQIDFIIDMVQLSNSLFRSAGRSDVM